MLLAVQPFHKFHCHLISQGIADDDRRFQFRCTNMILEEIRLTLHFCNGFKSSTHLLHAAKPFKIEFVGDGSIVCVHPKFYVLHRFVFFLQSQFRIEADCLTIIHVKQVELAGISAYIETWRVEFQRVNRIDDCIESGYRLTISQ